MPSILLTQTRIEALKPRERPYEVRDTKVRGLLIRVQPSGSMRYYVEVARGRRTKLDGRPGPITPRAARIEALKLLAKHGAGEDIRRHRSARQPLSEFIAKHYQPWAEANRKSGAATVKRLQACFAGLLSKPIGELSAEAIDKWRTARLKSGAKAATINRDVTALKAALSKALEWGYLRHHPLELVRPLKVDSRGKVRYLDQDEERRLRAALDLAPAYLRALVLCAINTGLRRGELFGLTWDNVDLKGQLLTVEGATAKSAATRHVPLNKEVLAALKNWKKQVGNVDLVFPGRDGARLDNVKRSWATLLQRAKIQNFRFHDLRHHFASRLVMAGADLNTVRELLGHGDIKMTLRYAHLAPEHKARVVALLEAP